MQLVMAIFGDRLTLMDTNDKLISLTLVKTGLHTTAFSYYFFFLFFLFVFAQIFLLPPNISSFLSQDLSFLSNFFTCDSSSNRAISVLWVFMFVYNVISICLSDDLLEEEGLRDVPLEDEPEFKRGHAVNRDKLSSFSCRYLRLNGYCEKYPKIFKDDLCYAYCRKCYYIGC